MDANGISNDGEKMDDRIVPTQYAHAPDVKAIFHIFDQGMRMGLGSVAGDTIIAPLTLVVGDGNNAARYQTGTTKYDNTV